MASVTFQILEGLERGDVFESLPTPLTIGREEDNQIRLNDERVSRFHAKIQEDDGRVILTDLESTNGTRVNGHPVKMRVLQIGDQVLIGRCLLLYGSADEIQRTSGNGSAVARSSSPELTVASNASFPDEGGNESSSISGELFDEVPFPHGPPEPPGGLSPVQAAQVSDMLSYVQSQILRVLLNSQERVSQQQSDSDESCMLTPLSTWHELQQVQMQLSLYLKEVADPSRS